LAADNYIHSVEVDIGIDSDDIALVDPHTGLADTAVVDVAVCSRLVRTVLAHNYFADLAGNCLAVDAVDSADMNRNFVLHIGIGRTQVACIAAGTAPVHIGIAAPVQPFADWIRQMQDSVGTD